LMKNLAWTIIIVASAPIASSLSAQAAGACYDSTTVRARGYRDSYGVLVSRNDSVGVRLRGQVGLPSLSNSQVRIIGDTAICRIASQAYDATLAVPYPSEPLIVLELGARRVVIKDIGFSGSMMNLLFDQGFTTMLQRMWH